MFFIWDFRRGRRSGKESPLEKRFPEFLVLAGAKRSKNRYIIYIYYIILYYIYIGILRLNVTAKESGFGCFVFQVSGLASVRASSRFMSCLQSNTWLSFEERSQMVKVRSRSPSSNHNCPLVECKLLPALPHYTTYCQRSEVRAIKATNKANTSAKLVGQW